MVFDLPQGHEIQGGWLRVRDEGDKITMSLKVVDGDKIYNQKEIQLTIDSFEEAKKFLSSIGCKEAAYQENKRELWILDEIEITIDEWPFLDPFVEVEGKSENEVKLVAEKLSFDYQKAKFCSVDTIYSEKYGVSIEMVNKASILIFEMENPFLSK